MPTIEVTSPVTLPAGQVLAYSPGDGANSPGNGFAAYLVDSNSSPTSFTPLLDIAGTLLVSSHTSGVYGVTAFEGNPLQGVVIESSGVVNVTSDFRSGDATGYYASGFSTPSFVNYGHLTVASSSIGRGVDTYDISGTITNRGTIDVSAGMSANGIFVHNSYGQVLNTGTIAIHGGAQGLPAIGIVSSAVEANITNGPGGVIIADDSTPGFGAGTNSIGISIQSLVSASPGMMENFGLIQADIAVSINLFGTATLGHTWSFYNRAGGVIHGEVVFGPGSESFENAGTVEGNISLGADNDGFDGTGGHVTGLVSGNEGDDVLFGSEGFDYLQGNQGNDDIRGNDGDDWVVGGKDDDLIFGNNGLDVVLGNLGNDTLDGGSGADQVRGGQGDDLLDGGDGSDFLSGDRGDDTVTGGGGADIFHGSQDAGIDRIVDFHVSEGDRVQLDPGTTYSLQQVGGDVVINMGGANQMILVGVQLSTLPPGWIFES